MTNQPLVGSRAWYNQETSSWQAWGGSLLEESAPFDCNDWPRLGLVIAGQLLSLYAWEHPTKELDYTAACDMDFLSHHLQRVTPSRFTDKKALTVADWKNSSAGKRLGGMASRGTWPTPLAQSGRSVYLSGCNTLEGQGLATAVATHHLWIPTAKEASAIPSWTDFLMADPPDPEVALAARFQWSEHPGDTAREKYKTLNPGWVELLMGFPQGWTDETAP